MLKPLLLVSRFALGAECRSSDLCMSGWVVDDGCAWVSVGGQAQPELPVIVPSFRGGKFIGRGTPIASTPPIYINTHMHTPLIHMHRSKQHTPPPTTNHPNQPPTASTLASTTNSINTSKHHQQHIPTATTNSKRHAPTTTTNYQQQPPLSTGTHQQTPPTEC